MSKPGRDTKIFLHHIRLDGLINFSEFPVTRGFSTPAEDVGIEGVENPAVPQPPLARLSLIPSFFSRPDVKIFPSFLRHILHQVV
jgi:hypothetical protein